MTQDVSKNNLKKMFFFILGGAILVLGIALVLSWWVYVEIIFKGAVGVLLALAGMLILFLAK